MYVYEITARESLSMLSLALPPATYQKSKNLHSRRLWLLRAQVTQGVHEWKDPVYRLIFPPFSIITYSDLLTPQDASDTHICYSLALTAQSPHCALWERYPLHPVKRDTMERRHWDPRLQSPRAVVHFIFEEGTVVYESCFTMEY
jgi:hypothetical protein